MVCRTPWLLEEVFFFFLCILHFLSHGIAVCSHLALNHGGMTSEPPMSGEESLCQAPQQEPHQSVLVTRRVLGLRERRRVGVGPPAARTVHRAHSPLLPTSEEPWGRRAGRRELQSRCVAPVGPGQGAPAPNAPGGCSLIGAVQERDPASGAGREREIQSGKSCLSLFSSYLIAG